MKKKGIIDRFEEDWAVVEMEDGEFADIPTDTLPSNAEEGSVIYIDKDGKVLLSVQETQDRRDKVKNLMDKLFEE